MQPEGVGSRDCGASFIDSARPDGEGYVTTFWERGTLAGQVCTMEVRLVVDGQPRVDTVFVAEFEPGAPTTLQVNCGYFCGPVAAGDTVDIRDFFEWGRDEYGNHLDAQTLKAWPESEVEWVWTANGQPFPTQPAGSGWSVEVPASDNDNLTLWFSGKFAVSLPFTVES